MDDDLYGSRLTPPPQTSPIVRGAAVAMVTVALVGCSDWDAPRVTDDANPGARVVDAGIYAADTGLYAMDAGLAPGVPAQDTGPDIDTDIDAGNPGDHP